MAAAIQELVARCMAARDRASESVVADWCEENGFRLHAEMLRAGMHEALPHLRHWLGPPPLPLGFGPALFRDAMAFFRGIDRRPARAWSADAKLVFQNVMAESCCFAHSFEGKGKEGLTAVERRYPEDLMTIFPLQREREPEKICSFADVLRLPCAKCRAPSVVIIHTNHFTMLGGSIEDDPVITTALTLCLREPHRTVLATSPPLERAL